MLIGIEYCVVYLYHTVVSSSMCLCLCINFVKKDRFYIDTLKGWKRLHEWEVKIRKKNESGLWRILVDYKARRARIWKVRLRVRREIKRDQWNLPTLIYEKWMCVASKIYIDINVCLSREISDDSTGQTHSSFLLTLPFKSI